MHEDELTHEHFVSQEPLLSLHRERRWSLWGYFTEGTQQQVFWKFVTASLLLCAIVGWAVFCGIHQDISIQQYTPDAVEGSK